MNKKGFCALHSRDKVGLDERILNSRTVNLKFQLNSNELSQECTDISTMAWHFSEEDAFLCP